MTLILGMLLLRGKIKMDIKSYNQAWNDSLDNAINIVNTVIPIGLYTDEELVISRKDIKDLIKKLKWEFRC